MTIYLCGDSTASTYPPDYAPQAGWGQCFQDFFDDSVTVDNRAIGARSTKSFIAEGRLLAIEKEIKPDDYLFVQFGHNDQARIRWRQTDALTSYRDNLILYVETARCLGARVVLFTSICQRVFDQHGVFGESLAPYPAAARAVAAQYNVPLIDLYAKTSELVASLGDEGSKSLYMHLKGGEYPHRPVDMCDNTHTQYAGAFAFARLAALGVRERALPGLCEHLKGELLCM